MKICHWEHVFCFIKYKASLENDIRSCVLLVGKAHHEIWENYKNIAVIGYGLSRNIIKTSAGRVSLLAISYCLGT